MHPIGVCRERIHPFRGSADEKRTCQKIATSLRSLQ